MKKHVFKQVSLVLSICILFHMFTPLAVLAAGETVSVSLDKTCLVKSDLPQEVVMQVKLENAVEGTYSFDYEISTPDGVVVTGTTADRNGNKFSGMIYANNFTNGVGDLKTITFQIPSLEVGEYAFYVKNVIMYSDLLGKENVSIPVTNTAILHIVESESELPSVGYTANLSGPAAATLEQEITYKVTVDQPFAAAELQVRYDNEKLNFTGSAQSISNGLIKIATYGADNPAGYSFELPFIADNTGEVTVELEAAAFGTQTEAETADLKAAQITNAAVATTINKATHTVTVNNDILTDVTIEHGGSYTYQINDYQPANYQYELNVTMNDQSVDVTINTDGNVTIANVTDDLVITLTKTAKKYDVIFKTTSGVLNLPKEEKATYGEVYSVDLPTAETHYALVITSVSINGQIYTGYTVDNDILTIPGEAIAGEIEIVIDQVQNEFPVTVNGISASELANYSEYTTAGQYYTLEISPETPYVYTVTATVSGQTVQVTASGNQYTIEAPTGPVVFTVTKSLPGEAEVTEYIKLDGTSMYLIQYKTTKLNGQVYTCQGKPMFWSSKYNAYCCLMIDITMPDVAFGVEKKTTTEIDYSCDVNMTGKVDANDAQLVYNIYNASYSTFTENVTIEKFLRADVDGNRTVNTADAAKIIEEIYAQ